MVIGYTSFSSKLANQESPLMDNWITEVANYQLLYVRETVTPAPKLSDSSLHIYLTMVCLWPCVYCEIMQKIVCQKQVTHADCLTLNGQRMV